MSQIHGVDVFEGDGQVSWPQVKKFAEFAYIKISEGDYIDSSATALRVQQAREAGVLLGGYVFLRPKAGRAGAEEVRIFLDHARKIGLYDGKHKALRPVLDFEASGFDVTTRVGRFRTRLYLQQAIREVRKQLGGRHPVIYTGEWWTSQIGLRWNGGCDVWAASYTAKPIVPAAWTKRGALLWQYTDRAVVPGIQKPCDANVYLGPDGLAGLRARLLI